MSRRQGLAADALLLGGSLLMVLAWDVAGGDRALSAWAGGAAGFPLRAPGSWAGLVHEAGRALAALLLALQAAHALGPRRSALRVWTLLATVAVLVTVPLIKRASSTSCPWDVLDFGGPVPYVPHLWLWVRDGGPGRCFPSSHAVAAFAFFVPAVALRRHATRAGPAALAGVLLLGALFGTVQVLRGAHYLSHVLWSGWLCLALAVAASRGWAAVHPRQARRARAAGPA